MQEFPIQPLNRKEDKWPELPYESWRDTIATLHMWTQVAGKIRLALAPLINHWWEVPLYVTVTGLTTSAIPYGGISLQIDFDFLAHRLLLRSTEGKSHAFPLRPMTVAAFYRELMAGLESLGTPVSIRARPVEVENPIPFEKDREHRSYDPILVRRFFRALVLTEQVFTGFRAAFVGKNSPVQFFWGGFDLAVTRFSGRPAPLHPPTPFTPVSVVREAYSHEVYSCGFWPGNETIPEAAYYAYAYPEPAGFKEADIEPLGAFYSRDLGEFILPYEHVRQADDPRGTLMRFLETTYAAAARLGGWDRERLERQPSRLQEVLAGNGDYMEG